MVYHCKGSKPKGRQTGSNLIKCRCVVLPLPICNSKRTDNSIGSKPSHCICTADNICSSDRGLDSVLFPHSLERLKWSDGTLSFKGLWSCHLLPLKVVHSYWYIFGRLSPLMHNTPLYQGIICSHLKNLFILFDDLEQCTCTFSS